MLEALSGLCVTIQRVWLSSIHPLLWVLLDKHDASLLVGLFPILGLFVSWDVGKLVAEIGEIGNKQIK